jgi:hypothetical protein
MENILSENREKGWSALPDTAPSWVRSFVTEFRTAALAARRMRPEFMRAFIRDSEQRSAMRQQIERFNKIYRPTIIPRTRVVTKSSSTISSDEARRLAHEFSLPLEEIFVARTLEVCSGIPIVDTLNRIRLRYDAARIKRGAELAENDWPEDDKDDDWDDERHAREATRHRVLAMKSNFDDGVKHLKCADAHAYASNNFSTESSRRARKASRLAFPESVIS